MKSPLPLLLAVLLPLVACSASSGGGEDAGNTDDTITAPDSIATDSGKIPIPQERLDYLVITTPELAGSFESFVEWKRLNGYATQLVTTADIHDAIPIGDEPSRIRAYLQALHGKTDLKWVLLGGDHPELPRREIHCTADVPAELTFVDTDVASELYYADMDGDWDGDGDGVLAEPGDGLDLQPDLYLGRLPVDSPAEVATYLDKLKAWETAAYTDYQDRVLFLAEVAAELNGLEVHSSLVFEELLKPMLPDTVRLTRLYQDHDVYPGSQPNTAANQKKAFADGHALSLDFGHGDVQSLCNLWGDQILGLQDTGRPGVYWTTECYSGMFDSPSYECGGENFIRSPGGGVAYVGNTDFGVGVPSIVNLTEVLFEELYGPGDETRLGPLLATCLGRYSDAELFAEPDSADRWTNLTLALFGDPSIRLWTGPARIPDVKVTHEGQKRTVTVTVQGQPVADARVSVYAPGESPLVTHTNAQGSAQFTLPSPVADWSTTVSGLNMPVTTHTIIEI